MARKSNVPKSKKQDAFLEALATGVSIRTAAKLAGAGCSTVFEWRKVDPEFAEDWECAYAAGTAELEAEAHRRAVDGVNEKPVVVNGKIVGHTKEYSDLLLIFLLKARDPETYCDRARALALIAKRARREAEEGKADPAARQGALDAIEALERLASAKAAQPDTLH